MPNGDLISRSAAIAAMREATKGEAFNPFKVLNELPEAEAYTREEIEAAVKDREHVCNTGRCASCDYELVGYGCFITARQIEGLMHVYRARKEAAG